MQKKKGEKKDIPSFRFCLSTCKVGELSERNVLYSNIAAPQRLRQKLRSRKIS